MAKPVVPKEDAERKRHINEHLKNADRLLKTADFDAAMVEIDGALSLDPNNYYALAYKGRILDGMKEKGATAAPKPPPPPAPVLTAPEPLTVQPPPTPPAPVEFRPAVSSPEPEAPKPVKREYQRKLAAIMFTDMVNYTAITQKNEPLAIQLLELHRKILRPIFKQYEGDEIKTIGDAFLVEFVSVFQAVKSAISIQNAISKYNNDAQPDKKIYIRIGIHIGDVIYQEDDIIGDGVNLASRIQERAEAGGICISQDVYNQIRTRDDFHTEDMGEMTLKNVLTPIRLFRVFTTEEAYKKVEEKAIEASKIEGRQNALKEVSKKYLENAKSALEANTLEEALEHVFGLLTIDPNNAEAKSILDKIKVERAKETARLVDQARSIPRQTFVDMYQRLVKRSWSDGALSSVELTLLDNVRSSFQIGNDEHRAFEREAQREVYADLLQKYLAIAEPTEDETEQITVLRKELNVSDTEHEALVEKLRPSKELNTF